MEVTASVNEQETGICVRLVSYLRGDGEEEEVGDEWDGRGTGRGNAFAASSLSNEADLPQIAGSLMNGWTSRAQVRDEAARRCLQWNKIKKEEKKEEGGKRGRFLFSQVLH